MLLVEQSLKVWEREMGGNWGQLGCPASISHYSAEETSGQFFVLSRRMSRPARDDLLVRKAILHARMSYHSNPANGSMRSSHVLGTIIIWRVAPNERYDAHDIFHHMESNKVSRGSVLRIFDDLTIAWMT